MEVDYTVLVDTDQIVRKLKSKIDEGTMLEIHELFRKTIDPWVPFKNNPLSSTVEVTPNYIRYVVPYAHYQYIGISVNGKPFEHYTRTYHPLATAMWDKVAMQTQLEIFEKEVLEIIRRRTS